MDQLIQSVIHVWMIESRDLDPGEHMLIRSTTIDAEPNRIVVVTEPSSDVKQTQDLRSNTEEHKFLLDEALLYSVWRSLGIISFGIAKTLH